MRKILVLITVCVASSAFAQTIYVRKDGVTTVAGYQFNPTSKQTISGGNGSGTGCLGSGGKFYSAILTDPSGVAFPMPLAILSNAALSIGNDYFVKPTQESTVTCGSVDYLKVVVSKHPWKRKANDVGPTDGRAWTNFAAPPSGTVAYTYGGSNSSFSATNTFYSYDDSSATWTSKSSGKVGNRQWHASSTDNSKVWLHAGSSGVGLTNTTWAYTVSTDSWSACSCKKVGTNCPNSVQMQTMTYDPSRAYSVMFGGRFASSGSNETWTLSTACAWTKKAPTTSPGERNRHCMAYVPSHTNADSTSITMNKVVLYGGQNYSASSVLNTMYAWDGTNWGQITLTNGPPGLHTHGCGWNSHDSSNPRLNIMGGYTDTSDTPNFDSYFCKFTSSTAATCEKETNPTNTDGQLHAGGATVYLPGSGKTISYGGEKNVSGSAVRYRTLDHNRVQ